jgi:zinc transport system substrate-binding protein
MRTRIIVISILGAVFLATAAGCGGSSPAAGSKQSGVVAAFYPLAWAAGRITGEPVTNLTPPGAEPHDIELTPKQVAAIQQAKVVLYLSHGFQPAVEDAVRGATGTRFDALAGQSLRAGTGDEAGKTDPHVWLDPIRFAAIVTRLGVTLGHPARGRALAARIRALDQEYRRGLQQCRLREFISSHAAFAYLAQRYGLHMLAITGVDPESEPSAQSLARLAALVREKHIGTVFFEKLISPKLAQTVAREAGAQTAVLDPIEGLTPAEQRAGADYLTIMHANLRQLEKALACRS